MAEERKRTRLPAAERERQLIDASIDVFLEKGYRLSTAEAIARKAGASTGTFYHYFRSKEEVLARIVDDYVAGFERVLGSNRARVRDGVSDDAFDAWRQNILAILDYHRQIPKVTAVIYRIASGRGREITALIRKVWRLSRSTMADEFNDLGDKDIIIPHDWDLFTTMINGGILNLVLQLPEDGSVDVEAMADKLVAFQVRGLAPGYRFFLVRKYLDEAGDLVEDH